MEMTYENFIECTCLMRLELTDMGVEKNYTKVPAVLNLAHISCFFPSILDGELNYNQVHLKYGATSLIIDMPYEVFKEKVKITVTESEEK
jgi:hypothetical protein